MSSPLPSPHKIFDMKETSNPSGKRRKFSLLMVDEHANNDITIDKDRLSLLPDCILVDILSLLSIDTAGKTCVLSKRWRYLWTQLTHICFDLAFCERRDNFKFYTNISDVLRSLSFTKIHSLYIWFPDFPPYVDLGIYRYLHERDYYPRVKSWLRLICTKCPEKIELRRPPSDSPVGIPVLTLPSCIFQCQTLVTLRLEGDFLIKTPEDKNCCLPKLKMLYMKVCFGDADELLRVLFKSCPVLEALKLVWYYQPTRLPPFVDITCPSLIALEIRVHAGRSNGIDTEFHIDAPKLRYIFVEDYQNSAYTFGECPSELYKGKLSYMRNKFSDITRASKLIQGVSRARCLDFSTWCFLDNSVLPIFTNLKSLNLGVNFKLLPAVLYKCPKLKKLSVTLLGVTVDLNSIAKVPVCLLRTLKKIYIRSFKGTEKDFPVLRYILQNAEVLELLDVRLLLTDCSEDVQRSKSAEYSKKISMLPRSSIFCKIIVRSSCLTVGSVHFLENTKKRFGF